MNYIVGLGNPEIQYFGTRHNIGRRVVENFAKENNFPDFIFNKKYNALISEGDFVYLPEGRKTSKKIATTLILPETYMNKSGLALKKIINSKKKAEMTTVVYDDLDLGVGIAKMNFNRGSGGHRGLESVIKSIGTKSFNRIRVGISKTTSAGKVKKPKGEEQVVKHVLGKFSPNEQDVIKKTLKKVMTSIELFVTEGRDKATGFLNSHH